MGTTTPLIIKVETPDYKKIVIETTDGFRYESDLTALENVYCFPANKTEWDLVSPDSFGTALIWTSRFEVHIDQIIGLAFKTNKMQQSA